jgi:uncharacterized protein (TIGR02466 family)
MITLDPVDLFPTRIFVTKQLEFLPTIQNVANKFIAEAKAKVCDNEIYPICQTDSIFADEETGNFCNFILAAATAMLENQGFETTNFKFNFNDMFVQEHRKGSSHDRHSHPNSVISGFYFLKVPPNSSKITFYDPRPAKEFGSFFPERDGNILTPATISVNHLPEEGLFLFSNSWLQHSFSRNESEEPFILVHFDLYPIYDPVPTAIVV